MVGGGPDTQAVFHVTRGPLSLPSFVQDVAWAFASWLNSESLRFASGESADYPMVAAAGGKEPLRAEYSAYTMGSDHDVYQDSSFGIGAIYLNDWPDRYIHTNFDTAANIDPTKLERAAFIGTASGYFLANFSARDVTATRSAVEVGRLLRTAERMQRHSAPLSAYDQYERGVLRSLDVYAGVGSGHGASGATRREGSPLFHRRPTPRGPMAVFGYDYFEDHAQADHIPTPRLLSYDGAWGSGMEYAYEALNFADGTRSGPQIAAALSAEYGAVPEELVLEYLQALQKIGVVGLD
jgi:hypothetical protein